MHRNPGEPFEEQMYDGRWLLVTERRMSDGGLATLRTDITERKRSEAELIEAKTRAEQASAAKSQFLANMSHELRTPLNAIIGFAEVLHLQTFGPLGTLRYVEYADAIRESGRHLLNLVNDLLDTARIDAGKHVLAEEPCDVAEAVAGALRIVRERAEAGEVALESDVAERLPPLYADARCLKQILLNLLSNSIKFTPSGDRVRTSAGLVRDGGLRIAVSDTGVGMPSDLVARAFDAFVQPEFTYTRTQGGAGLGLHLTRALVELHGGTVELESKIGIGTTVTVTMPPSRWIAASATA